MISTSPLRYPGGKTRFTKFIENAIGIQNKETRLFIEPFCGGAGASIALLESGVVQQIALNDVDPLVSSFWKVVFGKNRKSKHDFNWLINKIESTKISISEWKKQKNFKPDSDRTAAWKCLFLNRTSFNGILYKAGPIGGWEQKARTLDVRFNREKLINRLSELYDLRDQIEKVSSVNWRLFSSYYRNRKNSYLYFDPPYFRRAEQLYGYLFNEAAHKNLRDYLLKLSVPWMLSYDDAPEIRQLYSTYKKIHGRVIDQTYSANPIGGASHIGRELFYSNRVLPAGQKKSKILHVGLTIIGCVNEVKLKSTQPVRIPLFERLSAVGS